jgi:hypothetical protein
MRGNIVNRSTRHACPQVPLTASPKIAYIGPNLPHIANNNINRYPNHFMQYT